MLNLVGTVGTVGTAAIKATVGAASRNLHVAKQWGHVPTLVGTEHRKQWGQNTANSGDRTPQTVGTSRDIPLDQRPPEDVYPALDATNPALRGQAQLAGLFRDFGQQPPVM
jgi:hypothetical protein